jgi:hypothetical protein
LVTLSASGFSNAHLPYSDPDSLRRLTPADLAAFHKDRIQPDFCSVVVASPLPEEDVLQKIVSTFGRVPPRPHPTVLAICSTPETNGPMREDLTDPRASQGNVDLALRVCLAAEDGWEAAFHLTQLITLQFQRVRGAPAGSKASCRASLVPQGKTGLLRISCNAEPTDLDAVLKYLRCTFQRLGERGISRDELAFIDRQTLEHATELQHDPLRQAIELATGAMDGRAPDALVRGDVPFGPAQQRGLRRLCHQLLRQQIAFIVTTAEGPR